MFKMLYICVYPQLRLAHDHQLICMCCKWVHPWCTLRCYICANWDAVNSLSGRTRYTCTQLHLPMDMHMQNSWERGRIIMIVKSKYLSLCNIIHIDPNCVCRADVINPGQSIFKCRAQTSLLIYKLHSLNMPFVYFIQDDHNIAYPMWMSSAYVITILIYMTKQC